MRFELDFRRIVDHEFDTIVLYIRDVTPEGQRIRQVALAHGDGAARARPFLQRQDAVTGNLIGIEQVRLDTPDQGVIEDVFTAMELDAVFGDRFTLGGDVVLPVPADEAHHRGEREKRPRTIATHRTLDDGAPVGVMKRRTAGRADAAETNYQRESCHYYSCSCDGVTGRQFSRRSTNNFGHFGQSMC